MKKVILFIISSLIIFSLIFIAEFACSQNEDSSLVDGTHKNSAYIPAILNVQTSDSLSYDDMILYNSAVDVTSYLPVNYVGNASVDYTSYIQKCLNANKIVKMPNFPLLINESGLNVSSGARIFFQNESSLVMKANSLTFFPMVSIRNVNDVIIYSPVLVGDRDKHLVTEGEWGHGIYIGGSKNIIIRYPNISNCWGDGIDIGMLNAVHSENVAVLKGKIDNCRRNGISICDGINIKIQNTIISNTNGTDPMCGLDIEPNDNDAVLESIVISNVTTIKNSFGGILIALNYLVGAQNKTVGIEVNNHIDAGSGTGFVFWGCDSRASAGNALSGSIVVNNPVWINNVTEPVGSGGVYDRFPKTTINNLNVINDDITIQAKMLKSAQSELQYIKAIVQ